jgi:hypothetical protein
MTTQFNYEIRYFQVITLPEPSGQREIRDSINN